MRRFLLSPVVGNGLGGALAFASAPQDPLTEKNARPLRWISTERLLEAFFPNF